MKNEKLKNVLLKFNTLNEHLIPNSGIEIIQSKDANHLKGGYAPASDCNGFSCNGYAIACGIY
jgi:hypothetical protein